MSQDSILTHPKSQGTMYSPVGSTFTIKIKLIGKDTIKEIKYIN